jgi:hypothetical protein
MVKFIENLAATIIERSGGYMENDVWDANERLKVVPRDTIWVREINLLRTYGLTSIQAWLDACVHVPQLFRSSPVGNGLSSHPSSKIPSSLSQAQMGPP